MPALLEIEDIPTYFSTNEGIVKAVNGISLSLHENRVLGVVGESGSGKTMTALSILQLVPFPGDVVKGKITYDGAPVLFTSEAPFINTKFFLYLFRCSCKSYSVTIFTISFDEIVFR